MGKTGSGKSGGSSKSGMTPKDAARIQSAGHRHPKSETAKSGFASRAQSAADKSAQNGNK
jgi:Seed maturation protein